MSWSFDGIATDVGWRRSSRATAASGITQPEVPPWNRRGVAVGTTKQLYLPDTPF